MLIASTLSSSNNADFGPASKFVRIVDQMWTRVARFCSSNGEVVGEMWAAVGDLWGPPDLTMGFGRGGWLVWGHGSPNGSPNAIKNASKNQWKNGAENVPKNGPKRVPKMTPKIK